MVPRGASSRANSNRLVTTGDVYRGDYRDLPADQIGGQRRQSFVMALRPTVFDRDVATLDKTRLVEALVERGHDKSQL